MPCLSPAWEALQTFGISDDREYLGLSLRTERIVEWALHSV